VRAQAGRLAWHLVYRGGGLHVPGARLLRLSADLATGSAGVLLALHVALGRGDRLLPLLPPVARHGTAAGSRWPEGHMDAPGTPPDTGVTSGIEPARERRRRACIHFPEDSSHGF
jgi:hypothetical protein